MSCWRAKGCGDVQVSSTTHGWANTTQKEQWWAVHLHLALRQATNMGGLVSQFCIPSPYNAQIGALDLAQQIINWVTGYTSPQQPAAELKLAVLWS
jgi:hypothetical protein